MSDAKQCPDCGSQIGARAASCKCGWRADLAKAMHAADEAAKRERSQCFVEGCPYPALMVVNGRKTCVVHHDDALRPPRTRSPGEDDEPVAHA